MSKRTNVRVKANKKIGEETIVVLLWELMVWTTKVGFGSHFFQYNNPDQSSYSCNLSLIHSYIPTLMS